MSTRPDSRQIKQRTALDRIGVVAGDGQDVVNANLNQDADAPLRLSQSYPADARLNFGDSQVAKADGAQAVASPVQGTVYDSLSGLFINFQTQAVSSAPDFEITWPASTIGQFRRAGFSLNSDGKIEVVFSAEAVTQGALANAGEVLVAGAQPLGYIDLECTNVLGYFKTAGSATNVIENAGITRFAGGSGGGVFAIEAPVANNQVSPADVSDFVVDPSDSHVFTADLSIVRQHVGARDGTENTARYSLLGSAFNANVNSVVMQSDGKVIVGGSFTTFNGNPRKYLVRLNSDGTEDTAFYANLGAGFNSVVDDIAVQSDGKIVLIGSFTVLNVGFLPRIGRLNSDGTEDTAFTANLGAGLNGSSPIALAIQPDGKIVVGGDLNNFDGNVRRGLIRLNSDGTEDTAFYAGFGGTYNSGGSNRVFSVAVQPDGKILAGGEFDGLNGVFVTGVRNLLRLSSAGVKDAAFHTNLGNAFSSGYASTVCLQADGKIIVAGNFLDFNGNARVDIVRLNSDGTEDTAFYANLGTGFGPGYIEIASVQNDGKIVLAGTFAGGFNGNTRNRLLRLNSDGTEDTAFYANLGTAIPSGVVFQIAVAADDALILVGSFTTFNGNTRNRIFFLGTESSEALEYVKLNGIYSPSTSSWQVSTGPGFGVDADVDFTMTPAGQLQYTSSDVDGTPIESYVRFILDKL